ncbi:MAG: YcgN family cysteine cluster protein [Pseudomonadales bacterium]|nr:YcgN family cysteine cluster protein [Pseudomonadales bacterium]
MNTRFWETKTLSEMSAEEWESLCDGCARCCMIKLEDEDTQEIVYTSLVCKYLNQQSCRCTRYPDRHELVSDCVELNADLALEFSWLPKTCAYRVLAEGRSLEWWHPLVSGSGKTVHKAGISVRGKTISEHHVHPDAMEEHIINWIET